MPKPYPLNWIPGKPKTPSHERKRSLFQVNFAKGLPENKILIIKNDHHSYKGRRDRHCLPLLPDFVVRSILTMNFFSRLQVSIELTDSLH